MIGFRGLSAGPDTEIHRLIREYSFAGVLLFDEHVTTDEHERNITGPDQLRRLTTELQQAATHPLLIAVDQEGGRVARLNPRNGFVQHPSHAEMGETFEPAETRLAAAHIARTLADAGINLNFAPVVDVNIDPTNPIIGALGRSFSDDPAVVIDHARAFMAGHRDCGVLTAIKHFPGHGSSAADSHLTEADITDMFKQSELTPYRQLIGEAQVGMVMAGHLLHRGLDPELPASLSGPMIEGLLRDEMGFDGVVVTDDLDMAGVAERRTLRERVTLALNAGVDLLLFGNNLVYDPDRPAQVVDAIVEALQAGDVSEDCLRQHADRVGLLRSRLSG